MTRRLLAALLAPILVSACNSGERPTAPPPTTTASVASTVSPTAAVAAPPVPPPMQTKNWFDLAVGDCLADPPPTDPNVIAVTVVDCTTPHQAEVYLRAPLAVNTAVAETVDRTCGRAFATYTGQPVGDGSYAVTYLIDSNQNRTSSNPDPSTVICLLQAAGGNPLTRSARR